jgi:hypothetical protein
MKNVARTPKQKSQANMSDIVCVAMKNNEKINITNKGYRFYQDHFVCQCGVCVAINYTNERTLTKYERTFLESCADLFGVPVFVGDMDLDGGTNTEEGAAHCGCLS